MHVDNSLFIDSKISVIVINADCKYLCKLEDVISRYCTVGNSYRCIFLKKRIKNNIIYSLNGYISEYTLINNMRKIGYEFKTIKYIKISEEKEYIIYKVFAQIEKNHFIFTLLSKLFKII